MDVKHNENVYHGLKCEICRREKSVKLFRNMKDYLKRYVYTDDLIFYSILLKLRQYSKHSFSVYCRHGGTWGITGLTTYDNYLNIYVMKEDHIEEFLHEIEKHYGHIDAASRSVIKLNRDEFPVRMT